MTTTTLPTTITTQATAAYIHNGAQIVLGDGPVLEVERWEPVGNEVAVFNSWGERWLFGNNEPLTFVGEIKGLL